MFKIIAIKTPNLFFVMSFDNSQAKVEKVGGTIFVCTNGIMIFWVKNRKDKNVFLYMHLGHGC